jgi:hypothetical protein
MSKVGHWSVTRVQLAGSAADMNVQIVAKSVRVTVAQLASALTCWLKSETLSAMQALYCATVALQSAVMLVQLATAGPPCRQVASWLEQFFCS